MNNSEKIAVESNMNISGHIFTVRNIFTGICQSFCSERGVYPNMHWGRQPPPHSGQTPSWADTPTPWADTPPPGQSTPLGQIPPMATAVDGKYPTGMHAC